MARLRARSLITRLRPSGSSDGAPPDYSPTPSTPGTRRSSGAPKELDGEGTSARIMRKLRQASWSHSSRPSRNLTPSTNQSASSVNNPRRSDADGSRTGEESSSYATSNSKNENVGLAELEPIIGFLHNQANKPYQEGYLLKLDDLDTNGRPCTCRKWTECFAQLTGTALAFWDANELDNASGITDVPASYLNVIDASIKIVDSLPTNGASSSLTNVISISTAGQNRFLLHLNSQNALAQWAAAIRLAIYERTLLQESYTGALIAGKGRNINGLRTILSGPTRFAHEDWVRVRFRPGTPWRKCWCVVEPPDEKETARLRREYKKENKSRSIYSRSNANTEKPRAKGCIAFYNDKKDIKKPPIARVTDAWTAHAVYPQGLEMIDHSTLIKVEGLIETTVPQEGKRKKKDGASHIASEGSIFVLPASKPAITGYEMLIRWLIPVFDAFNLYGRPYRLIADMDNPRSLMFALTRNQPLSTTKAGNSSPGIRTHGGYLGIQDVASLVKTTESLSWTEQDWLRRLKEVTAKKHKEEARVIGSSSTVSSSSGPASVTFADRRQASAPDLGRIPKHRRVVQPLRPSGTSDTMQNAESSQAQQQDNGTAQLRSVNVGHPVTVSADTQSRDPGSPARSTHGHQAALEDTRNRRINSDMSNSPGGLWYANGSTPNLTRTDNIPRSPGSFWHPNASTPNLTGRDSLVRRAESGTPSLAMPPLPNPTLSPVPFPRASPLPKGPGSFVVQQNNEREKATRFSYGTMREMGLATSQPSSPLSPLSNVNFADSVENGHINKGPESPGPYQAYNGAAPNYNSPRPALQKSTDPAPDITSPTHTSAFNCPGTEQDADVPVTRPITLDTSPTLPHDTGVPDDGHVSRARVQESNADSKTSEYGRQSKAERSHDAKQLDHDKEQQPSREPGGQTSTDPERLRITPTPAAASVDAMSDISSNANASECNGKGGADTPCQPAPINHDDCIAIIGTGTTTLDIDMGKGGDVGHSTSRADSANMIDSPTPCLKTSDTTDGPEAIVSVLNDSQRRKSCPPDFHTSVVRDSSLPSERMLDVQFPTPEISTLEIPSQLTGTDEHRPDVSNDVKVQDQLILPPTASADNKPASENSAVEGNNEDEEQVAPLDNGSTSQGSPNMPPTEDESFDDLHDLLSVVVAYNDASAAEEAEAIAKPTVPVAGTRFVNLNENPRGEDAIGEFKKNDRDLDDVPGTASGYESSASSSDDEPVRRPKTIIRRDPDKRTGRKKVVGGNPDWDGDVVVGDAHYRSQNAELVLSAAKAMESGGLAVVTTQDGSKRVVDIDLPTVDFGPTIAHNPVTTRRPISEDALTKMKEKKERKGQKKELHGPRRMPWAPGIGGAPGAVPHAAPEEKPVAVDPEQWVRQHHRQRSSMSSAYTLGISKNDEHKRRSSCQVPGFQYSQSIAPPRQELYSSITASQSSPVLTQDGPFPVPDQRLHPGIRRASIVNHRSRVSPTASQRQPSTPGSSSGDSIANPQLHSRGKLLGTAIYGNAGVTPAVNSHVRSATAPIPAATSNMMRPNTVYGAVQHERVASTPDLQGSTMSLPQRPHSRFAPSRAATPLRNEMLAQPEQWANSRPTSRLGFGTTSRPQSRLTAASSTVGPKTPTGPDIDRSLNAREQEFVARATGSSFFNLSSDNAKRDLREFGGVEPGSNTLVDTIHTREREKELFKKSHGMLQSQQVMAAIARRQAYAQAAQGQRYTGPTQQGPMQDPFLQQQGYLPNQPALTQEALAHSHYQANLAMAQQEFAAQQAMPYGQDAAPMCAPYAPSRPMSAYGRPQSVYGDSQSVYSRPVAYRGATPPPQNDFTPNTLPYQYQQHQRRPSSVYWQ